MEASNVLEKQAGGEWKPIMYIVFPIIYNVSVYHGALVHVIMKAEKSQDLQSELET